MYVIISGGTLDQGLPHLPDQGRAHLCGGHLLPKRELRGGGHAQGHLLNYIST